MARKFFKDSWQNDLPQGIELSWPLVVFRLNTSQFIPVTEQLKKAAGPRQHSLGVFYQKFRFQRLFENFKSKNMTNSEFCRFFHAKHARCARESLSIIGAMDI